MSEKKKRFAWSAEEKDWLKTWQPKLRRDLIKLSDQVERFEKAIPSLAAEAKEAAAPFLMHGWKLMGLSWKNKYNPLSYKEAESEYKKIDEKLNKWIAFGSRDDVLRAARGVNRTVQAKKRDYQRSLRDAHERIRADACDPDFENLIQKDVEVLEKGLRAMAELSIALQRVGTEQEIPILQRLISLAFVRSTYDLEPQASQAVRALITENPSATTRDLLACAVKILRVNTMLHRVKHPSFNGLDPEDIILSFLEQADRGVSHCVQSWISHGITLNQIDKSHFAVHGVDFSLEAKPI